MMGFSLRDVFQNSSNSPPRNRHVSVSVTCLVCYCKPGLQVQWNQLEQWCPHLVKKQYYQNPQSIVGFTMCVKLNRWNPVCLSGDHCSCGSALLSPWILIPLKQYILNKSQLLQKQRTFSYRGVPGGGARQPVTARLPCWTAVCSVAAAAEGLLGGASREGLLSRAPRQAWVARTGASAIRVGHIAGPTAVAPQGTGGRRWAWCRGGGVIEAQRGQVSAQVTLGYRFSSTEWDAWGHRWRGEVAGLGWRWRVGTVACVNRSPTQPRPSIALDGCSAEALTPSAAAAPKDVSAWDGSTPVTIGVWRGAVVAAAGGGAAQIAQGGVTWGRGRGGGCRGLVGGKPVPLAEGAKARCQGGAVGAVVAGAGGANIAFGGGGDAGHAAAAAVGFSATGRESLWKTASTASTENRQEY